MLAVLTLATAGCGAASAGGHPVAGRPGLPAAGSPPTMQLVVPSVRPLDVAGSPPAPASVASGTTPAPVRVRIPAIGVDSMLVSLGLNADGTIQVPPNSSEAGWYQNGPAPGDPGPAVILGHLDSVTGPAVFYRLSSMRAGQQVQVVRADGSVVTFVVQRIATFPVASFPTREVYGATTAPELRLITCGGSFDYVQGRYQANVVVFANAV